MSLIYWDTMLFAYAIENHPVYASRIAFLRSRMVVRGDRLCTSAITLGELLVPSRRTGDIVAEQAIRTFFASGAVEIISFTEKTADHFSVVRANANVPAADAIHLASAASVSADLFLTNDKALKKLVIPGISFIDGIDTTVLDV